MKIAVFGDSFAATDCYSYSRDPGPSWVEILSKNFDVTCFAEGGSSFYFSYKNLLDNANEFNYLILCVTDYWRMSLSNDLSTLISGSNFLHVSGINGVNYIHSKIKNAKNISIVEKQKLLEMADSIKKYFLYWRQNEEVKTFHNLMIDYLERNYKNIILIPCFKNSYGDDSPNNDIVSLFEISNNELRSKGFFDKFPDAFSNTPPLKEFNGRMLTDYRKCHLSQENNLILANIISNAVQNNFSGRLKLDKDLFVIPEKPLEFYLGLTDGHDTVGYPLKNETY